MWRVLQRSCLTSSSSAAAVAPPQKHLRVMTAYNLFTSEFIKQNPGKKMSDVAAQWKHTDADARQALATRAASVPTKQHPPRRTATGGGDVVTGFQVFASEQIRRDPLRAAVNQLTEEWTRLPKAEVERFQAMAATKYNNVAVLPTPPPPLAAPPPPHHRSLTGYALFSIHAWKDSLPSKTTDDVSREWKALTSEDRARFREQARHVLARPHPRKQGSATTTSTTPRAASAWQQYLAEFRRTDEAKALTPREVMVRGAQKYKQLTPEEKAKLKPKHLPLPPPPAAAAHTTF